MGNVTRSTQTGLWLQCAGSRKTCRAVFISDCSLSICGFFAETLVILIGDANDNAPQFLPVDDTFGKNRVVRQLQPWYASLAPWYIGGSVSDCFKDSLQPVQTEICSCLSCRGIHFYPSWLQFSQSFFHHITSCHVCIPLYVSQPEGEHLAF